MMTTHDDDSYEISVFSENSQTKKAGYPAFYNKVFNPLPDNKILDWSRLTQIADGILTHSHTMTPFDASWKQSF